MNDFMGRWSNDVNGVDVRAEIDGVMACLWFMLIVCNSSGIWDITEE